MLAFHRAGYLRWRRMPQELNVGRGGSSGGDSHILESSGATQVWISASGPDGRWRKNGVMVIQMS